MKINGTPYRTIWTDAAQRVFVIDQTQLPHRLQHVELTDLAAVAHAITFMTIRGAPLIGVTAAFGLALALRHDASDQHLEAACRCLAATRPTAVNLRWALTRVAEQVRVLPFSERAARAWQAACALADEDATVCEQIGKFGCEILVRLAEHQRAPLNILTHCNAGWLATVDFGTALAPVYAAHDHGVPIHVWVDETRPRNQGAALTAFELGAHGVPHTVIADNAGGQLMRSGRVDVCIVGADRVAKNGDVANKIGTYLKALAAHDTGLPFYVAFPLSTVDFSTASGAQIPIEERSPDEVTHLSGVNQQGEIVRVRVTPEHSAAHNPAFDVTEARLITAFVTERGVCPASETGLRSLLTRYSSHNAD